MAPPGLAHGRQPGHCTRRLLGGAAETAQRVDQIDHQQNMVQIERENKALESQAIADKAAGRVDPAHMDRQAYSDIYTRALGADHADKLTAGLKDRLASMKLDGYEEFARAQRTYTNPR